MSLSIPWRSIGANFRSARVTVRSALTGEVELTGAELLDLCAAIELDRVQRADAVDLLTQRRITKRPLVWCSPLGRNAPRDLVDGARGLTQSNAPGELTIEQCLARVGVEVVSERVLDMRAQRRAT